MMRTTGDGVESPFESRQAGAAVRDFAFCPVPEKRRSFHFSPLRILKAPYLGETWV